MSILIQRWLDEAGTAMSGNANRRRDALLELETAILERLDEGAEEPTESDIESVLRNMGDPEEVGSSMLPAHPIIPAHRTRAFAVHATAVFAVHFLMVIAATLAEHAIGVPPISVAPISDPRNVLEILGRMVHTAFLDIGTVLVAYYVMGRVGHIFRFPKAALSVQPVRRRCIETACFLALVLTVVNFFRDSLLALYVPTSEGARSVALVGPGITENILLFNAWLGLAIVRRNVHLLGGEVGVESEVEKGTTFTLSLPLVLDVPADRERATSAA